MDVIIPNTTYRYKLFGDISEDNPGLLVVSGSTQNISYQPRPKTWLTAHADDWGRWGHQAMPRQLLMAPGAGTFFNPAYAVASGELYIGGGSSNSIIQISIIQNSFGLVDGEVVSASFVLRSINFTVVENVTSTWQIICGAQNTFNGGPGFTTQIQLSVGAVLIQPGSSPTNIEMYQFEFQS